MTYSFLTKLTSDGLTGCSFFHRFQGFADLLLIRLSIAGFFLMNHVGRCIILEGTIFQCCLKHLMSTFAFCNNYKLSIFKDFTLCHCDSMPWNNFYLNFYLFSKMTDSGKYMMFLSLLLLNSLKLIVCLLDMFPIGTF